MLRYNWECPDWPDFRYSTQSVENAMLTFGEKTGRVDGMVMGMGDDEKMETVVELLVAEATKTSEIEGEYLRRDDVMSSIKKNLGLPGDKEHVLDKRAKGISEMLIDVRRTYAEKLTTKQMFTWHKLLFQGNRQIDVGAWRTHAEPMQIVSGAAGKEKVHFEAPPSSEVPGLMESFTRWFNDTAPGGGQEILNGVVRAAITHLYFESIHPFEDGNGRIGRALAEKALSQNLKRPVMLSLSKTIEKNKQQYYTALQQAQRSNEITPWIDYFVNLLVAAQADAEVQVGFTLKKVRFFDKFRNKMNERQMKVVRKMLEAGPAGFQGGMNASKYVSITTASKATATRDLQELLQNEIFRLFDNAGGRSTKYVLNI